MQYRPQKDVALLSPPPTPRTNGKKTSATDLSKPTESQSTNQLQPPHEIVAPSPPVTASSAFLRAHALLPQFDREYEMLDELGSGGFGFVVRARRHKDGLIVAVKFIFRDKVSG